MLGYCPNITGAIGSRSHTTGYAAVWNNEGAFYKNEKSTYSDQGLSSNNTSMLTYTTAFSANKSNALYGASATVQPSSLNLNTLIKY